MSSPFVRLMSSFSVPYYGGSSSSSEDLTGPLFKIVGHSPAGQSAGSLRMCPSSFYLLSVMVIYIGSVPVILYSLLLDILCGHWIPITFFSCLLWKMFSFLWSFSNTPQVPQLYNSTLFTSASYCRILVVSFVFQFFFQIMSFFARAIVASSFLLWISSRSPSFDPSFITFLHFLSYYLDPLFKVVYLVFSSFTNRFLLFIISFAFS